MRRKKKIDVYISIYMMMMINFYHFIIYIYISRLLTFSIQFVTSFWHVTRLTAIYPEEGRCIRPKYR